MPITKLLIANRGEIARRIAATCRAMGIEPVAVYADADAGARHVEEAAEAVPLGGGPLSATYLDPVAIVEAARRSGADAVHPGYGFLSERPELARACRDAGLTWVGPAPEVIEAMGSKLAARELMAAAGIPVLEGIDLSGLDADAAQAAAAAIAWPVLIKASAGGGGRGMRVVHEAGALAGELAAARREAASAFGDGTVFLERFVEPSRHVEVQILGDRHGEVVHLFERECSVQRRYQKIIEEAPAPDLDGAVRTAMSEVAVHAARAVGYVGAGTVELILAPDGRFWFLEMNTRIQVEHPVTEAVTGLDLVRLQLLVADGAAIPREARQATVRGHAIEARLYAEDPDQEFLPAPGRIDRLAIPARDGIRVDAGYRDGDEVSPHYDPLVAKVIAHGASRDEAARRLAATLRHTQVFGVTTNRELLVGILEHPEFLAGAVDTGFLRRRPPATMGAGRLETGDVALAAAAGALAAAAAARREATVLATVPAGWRNNPSAGQRRRFTSARGELVVEYRWPTGDAIEVNGVALTDVVPVAVATDRVDLVAGGVRRRFATMVTPAAVHVHCARGSISLHELPRLPVPVDESELGSLTAPMPATVVRVEAEVGRAVSVGEVLVVIEAMKMEHQVVAPIAGMVKDVCVAAGQAVDAGTVLVVVEGDAGSAGATGATGEGQR